MDRKITHDYSLRMGREEDWEEAMELAWKTFLRFEAKDYKEEGKESFRDFITDQWLKRMFLRGLYPMIIALDGKKIIGFITLRNESHISLLFVDGDYHYQGIGSSLIGAMENWLIKVRRGRFMTVNAAPYALEFYHKLGFHDTGGQQEKEGIRYTPMIRRF